MQLLGRQQIPNSVPTHVPWRLSILHKVKQRLDLARSSKIRRSMSHVRTFQIQPQLGY